jgi:hypothetical protein
MSNEIISSLIEGIATFLATGVLGIVAVLIANKASKMKETNRKLIEDWEFLYMVEEILLKESKSTSPIKTTKIKIRKQVADELGRPINYNGISHIRKIKTQ